MSFKLGKVLLVRLDRIGDLVLTLPVDESLRKVDPKVDVRWWIPKGLGFIATQARPARHVREVETQFDYARFKELLTDLKKDPPRMAIVFHAPWWVSLLLFLARVPVRAGPKSQWHQLLFLNRKIRQKRSQADAHELEYNFRLAEGALKLGSGWLPRNHLRLEAPTNDNVNRFGLESGNYIVVHPGMMGSALNWPPPLYAQLISRLSEQGRVVITGTAADEPYIKPIRDLLGDDGNVTWLNGRINGQQLILILKNAKAVVAPSTGVLHLAASCGTPTIGLFSPVRVQSETRWGPKGDRVLALTPDVECPGQLKCLGKTCRLFNCMQQVSVDKVRAALDEILAAPAPSRLGTVKTSL